MVNSLPKITEAGETLKELTIGGRSSQLFISLGEPIKSLLYPSTY